MVDLLLAFQSLATLVSFVETKLASFALLENSSPRKTLRALIASSAQWIRFLPQKVRVRVNLAPLDKVLQLPWDKQSASTLLVLEVFSFRNQPISVSVAPLEPSSPTSLFLVPSASCAQWERFLRVKGLVVPLALLEKQLTAPDPLLAFQ